MELLPTVGIVIEPGDHPQAERVEDEVVVGLGPGAKLYLGVEDGPRWVEELQGAVRAATSG